MYCSGEVMMKFEADKQGCLMVGGESWQEAVPVLLHTRKQGTSYTHVQRPVSAACHDVNSWLFGGHEGLWIPAFAGMTSGGGFLAKVPSYH